MKFTQKTHAQGKEILANDHYVAIPVNLANWVGADDGIVKAGSIVPNNDARAKGVLLNDVNINENPNGALVVHGFIKLNKLPEAPTTEAEQALRCIGFVPEM